MSYVSVGLSEPIFGKCAWAKINGNRFIEQDFFLHRLTGEICLYFLRSQLLLACSFIHGYMIKTWPIQA